MAKQRPIALPQIAGDDRLGMGGWAAFSDVRPRVILTLLVRPLRDLYWRSIQLRSEAIDGEARLLRSSARQRLSRSERCGRLRLPSALPAACV